jgi:hypothetical protein
VASCRLSSLDLSQLVTTDIRISKLSDSSNASCIHHSIHLSSTIGRSSGILVGRCTKLARLCLVHALIGAYSTSPSQVQSPEPQRPDSLAV